MGLNDIQLPEFIIEEWFKDNLVVRPVGRTAPNPVPGKIVPSAPAKTAPPTPQPTAQPPVSTAPAPLKSLGNNRRHITILIHAPDSPFLPDNQLAFLTKILEACRLTLADVAIVNNAVAPITITELKQQLQPKIILLFGPEPSALRLPINFPAFRPQDYDGCTYLSSPGLDQLVSNTEEGKLLKSKLWICLQTIFDV
jgi:hypothetical protein